MSGIHITPGHGHDHSHGHVHHDHHDGHHHHHDGHRHSHGHHGSGAGPQKRIFRAPSHPRSRRAFLGNFAKGTVAMAVVSPAVLAACSSDSDSSTGVVAAADPTAATEPAPTQAEEPTAPATADEEQPPESDATDNASGANDSTLEPVTWARANLGFVSAYVLARGNTAAIVDTGVAGSADAIGETLTSIGLNYSDVAHVILTHNHGDHAGSISEVLAQAVNATAYAGEADLGPLPGSISGLIGGEDIFGFEMLATPGHTAGHMAVIDHQSGLLVAGDAIFTEDGGVVEGPERFFADVPQSRQSIKAMAALTFNTLLVGHGEPIEDGASAAVAALAATL